VPENAQLDACGSIRLMKESGMFEIDVYYFFWMAGCILPLSSIQQNVPLAAVAADLSMARLSLETFSEKAGPVFPRTSEKATSIVECINAMIPRNPPLSQPNRLITIWEATTLRNNSVALTSALLDEAKHNYVLCVEDQRCLSAYSLVEKIETCFGPDSWNAIENSAKGEFEESGKCLAFERYTSSGFHALRGVECVIRQYIVKLTGSLPLKRDWGNYIKVLTDNGADPSLIAVIDNIRTLDRNPLMHPEDWLNVDEAIGIFIISQTAVVRLVAGIKK